MEVNHVKEIRGGFAEIAFLDVEIAGNDAEVGGGAALGAEGGRLIGGLAGIGETLESEKGAGAVEEAVGFPGGVVLDVEQVGDGGERLGEFSDLE